MIHSDFHLFDSELLVTSRNSHENAEELHDWGERIHIVVVDSEGGGGVRHFRIEFQGGEHLRARVDPRVSGGAILAAQRVDPYLERPAQACVGAHLRRIRFGELSFRESGYLASEREIISVVGFLAALPCFQDAVFNFAGGAVPLPPFCFAFDEISERVIGLRLFDVACHGDGRIRIAAVDFVECLHGFRRQRDAGAEGRSGK